MKFHHFLYALQKMTLLQVYLIKFKSPHAQAKATRFLFNKESLYIQRRKREIRQKNLEMAKQVAQKLPAFVELVDKAIQVHMLTLARNAVSE